MTRRRLFASLCSMVFLVNLARVVFAPLVEPLAAAFDVTPGALGAVATAAWLGSALPRLPTGYLLTRVSRTRVVAGSGLVLALAAALASAVNSVAALTVGAFLLGLSSGAYFIAANPLVSELFPGRVGRVIGVHGTAGQLAAAAAPVVVTGVLLVGTWRLAFRTIAVVAGLATVVLVVASRRADLPQAGGADRDLLGAVRQQWRILLTGVVVVGFTGFLWNGLFNYYVTYLEAGKDIPKPTGRLLLTVVFGAGVPAFFVTGRLADRFPNVPLLLAVVAGFLACVFALTAVQSLWAVAAVSVALGYVVHSLFPAVDTYLLASLPDGQRASAYAGYSASMMVVQALGSVTVGTLAARFPYDVIFRWFAAALVGMLAVMTLLHLAGRLPVGRAHRSGA